MASEGCQQPRVLRQDDDAVVVLELGLHLAHLEGNDEWQRIPRYKERLMRGHPGHDLGEVDDGADGDEGAARILRVDAKERDLKRGRGHDSRHSFHKLSGVVHVHVLRAEDVRARRSRLDGAPEHVFLLMRGARAINKVH